MAAGLPLIATRVGGIPELVEDGICGVLVDPGNGCELTRAIAAVLRDRAFRERLTVGARQTSQKFSWRASADAVADVLRSVALSCTY